MPPPRRWLFLWVLTLALWLGAGPAQASDCPPDDPSRSDCQAAATTAQNPLTPIGGAILGTVIAIAVLNGATIAQAIFNASGGQLPAAQEPTRITLDIHTQPTTPALVADGQEVLWIGARVLCNNPKVDAAALTRLIQFARSGPNSDWLAMDDGPGAGYKAISVRAWAPEGQSLKPGGAVIVCSVALGEHALSGAVPIALKEPRYEVTAQFDPAEAGRAVRGVTLARANEFVADGDDVLYVITSVKRTDVSPEKLVEGAEQAAELAALTDDFSAEKDAAFTEPGKARWRIKALKPLLFTAQTAMPLSLRVKAQVPIAPGERVSLPAKDIPLAPRCVYLKLWVVPGAQPGASEAGVVACLAPNSVHTLANLPVRLTVESDDAHNTAALTVADQADAQTDQAGHARWTLRYRGLTWDNAASARFKVKCLYRTQDRASDSVYFKLCVGDNVREVLTLMNSAPVQAALNLRNPWFAEHRWPFPNFMRGGAWNITHPTSDPYVCGNVSKRIFDWLDGQRHGDINRAFDPEQCAKMNGLEIMQYGIILVHYWAGLYLAGSGPNDDPRMLDPWWKQEWGEVLTWRNEIARLALLAEGVSVLVIALAATGLAVVGGAAGAVGASTTATALVQRWLTGKALLGMQHALVEGSAGVAFGSYQFSCGALTGEVLPSNGGYLNYSPLWLARAAHRWQSQNPVLGQLVNVE